MVNVKFCSQGTIDSDESSQWHNFWFPRHNVHATKCLQIMHAIIIFCYEKVWGKGRIVQNQSRSGRKMSNWKADKNVLGMIDKASHIHYLLLCMNFKVEMVATYLYICGWSCLNSFPGSWLICKITRWALNAIKKVGFHGKSCLQICPLFQWIGRNITTAHLFNLRHSSSLLLDVAITCVFLW